jgi:delta(3,5)-delta(2,4)-dienoyl-CoA isomerase
MWVEYGQIFNQLSTDSSVRAIVLSGAGERAFTAGLDLMSSEELTNPDPNVDAARKATALRRFIKEFQDAIGSVESCEKPVICVLHGISYGLAIDIATAADIRICASDTKFAVKEVDIGKPITLAPPGQIQLLKSAQASRRTSGLCQDFPKSLALSLGSKRLRTRPVSSVRRRP